jgi:hypothetical protein
MKAYCDGSGDKGSEFLVLTGVAASDYVWAGFENEWRRLLTGREPVAPFIHTCDMVALSGEFLPEKGWNEINVSQLGRVHTNYAIMAAYGDNFGAV